VAARTEAHSVLLRRNENVAWLAASGGVARTHALRNRSGLAVGYGRGKRYYLTTENEASRATTRVWRARFESVLFPWWADDTVEQQALARAGRLRYSGAGMTLVNIYPLRRR